MTKQTLRTLRFLRITDADDNLSLTNLALVATLVTLLTRPELSALDIGTFVASLIGYQVKRFTAPPKSSSEDLAELQAAVQTLQTKMTAFQLGAQTRK